MARRFLFSCIIVTLLAGCGAVSPPLGSRAASDRSWMLPEAQNEDLLYVTNVYTVTVYSYPEGQLVGTLSNFYKPYGLCADKAGDVYVTDTTFGKSSEWYKAV